MLEVKMKFQKSVIEIIKERKSCRSFSNAEIDNITLGKFFDFIDEINSEAKIQARFLFAKINKKSDGVAEKLGTYGMISGASTFIIGIIDKNEKNVLEFGYLFEKLILFATDLGLQTCWLGGTFNKNQFEQKASLYQNEFIPIVSPVGIKKEKPRIFETAVRAAVGANTRKPWNQLFFDRDINVPLNENSAGAYSIPLEMVRLGPSASNKQPWRIIKEGNQYHLFLCRTKGYGRPAFDIQKNDLGIAMCHFELSAKECGLNGYWNMNTNINVPDGFEYIATWVDGI